MAIKKYINIKEVVELTRHSHNEIINLVRTGVLPAHKARKGHWRLNVPDVEKYFDILINNPIGVSDEKPIKGEAIRVKPRFIKPKSDSGVKQRVTPKHIYDSLTNTSGDTRFVINEKHYQEVIQRICSAKSSIRIMTANFKRFKLKPTDNQGEKYNDGTPFIKYLMAKAVQGVSVQIICSMPSASFMEEWKEYYRQMMNPSLFEYKFCERNHAKIYIIDDTLAYVGSANVTPSGIGQCDFKIPNFEAGIITEDPAVISSLKSFFSMIMDGYKCSFCPLSSKCNN